MSAGFTRVTQKHMKLLSTLIIAAALAPAISHATVFNFDLLGKGGAGLIAGNENISVTGTPGTGGEIGSGITFDDVTNILSINIGWGTTNGFTNLTSDVNNAHVHGPTTSSGTASFTENAGVLFDLRTGGFSFSNSSSSGFITGTSTLSDVNETALFAGRLYVNIHTVTNGGGEIRGNIVNPSAIPEPSSYAALAGLGALGFVGLRRRRVQK